MKTYMAYLMAGITGMAIGWISNVPYVFWALIGLIILDVAAGLAAAFVTKTVNSDVSFRGMVKKSIVLMIVASAYILEQLCPVQMPLGSLTSAAFCLREVISILEKAKMAGITPPNILINAINKFHEKEIKS